MNLFSGYNPYFIRSLIDVDIKRSINLERSRCSVCSGTFCAFCKFYIGYTLKIIGSNPIYDYFSNSI